MRRELFERAKDFNIILDDVAITELSFSSQYTAAVEAKQVGKAQNTTISIQWITLTVCQNVVFILYFILYSVKFYTKGKWLINRYTNETIKQISFVVVA